MKSLRSIICIFICLSVQNICVGQPKESTGEQMKSLGQYWFVMYSKGSNWGRDSTTEVKINRDHIKYIVSLRKSGKVVTGGAFRDENVWTGFEIYNCKTKEEVIKITDSDPIVLSKIFSYEIHPWITLKGVVKFE